MKLLAFGAQKSRSAGNRIRPGEAPCRPASRRRKPGLPRAETSPASAGPGAIADADPSRSRTRSASEQLPVDDAVLRDVEVGVEQRRRAPPR